MTCKSLSRKVGNGVLVLSLGKLEVVVFILSIVRACMMKRTFSLAVIPFIKYIQVSMDF